MYCSTAKAGLAPFGYLLTTRNIVCAADMRTRWLALTALLFATVANAGGNGVAPSIHVSGAGAVSAGEFQFDMLMSGDGNTTNAAGKFVDAASGMTIRFVTFDQAGYDYLGRTGLGGLATIDGVSGFRYAIFVRDNDDPGAGVDQFDLHVIENGAPSWDDQVYSSNGCGVWDETCADHDNVLTRGDVMEHAHR
jgi:hypothetical protein